MALTPCLTTAMDFYPLYCPHCKAVTPHDADYCPECCRPVRPGVPPRDGEGVARDGESVSASGPAGLESGSLSERHLLPASLALVAFWGLLLLGALFRPVFPSPECLLWLALLLWSGTYLADQVVLPLQLSGAFGLGLVLGIIFTSTLSWLRTQP